MISSQNSEHNHIYKGPFSKRGNTLRFGLTFLGHHSAPYTRVNSRPGQRLEPGLHPHALDQLLQAASSGEVWRGLGPLCRRQWLDVEAAQPFRAPQLSQSHSGHPRGVQGGPGSIPEGPFQNGATFLQAVFRSPGCNRLPCLASLWWRPGKVQTSWSGRWTRCFREPFWIFGGRIPFHYETPA